MGGCAESSAARHLVAAGFHCGSVGIHAQLGIDYNWHWLGDKRVATFGNYWGSAPRAPQRLEASHAPIITRLLRKHGAFGEAEQG